MKLKQNDEGEEIMS